MDCVFCKIGKKEIDSDIIFEDDKVIVFKDIKPSAPVHLLVIPKEHIASVKDIKEEHRDLIAHLVFTARDIAQKKELAGYKLVFNVGREGGQLVDHIHLHLLGGWPGSENATGK